MSTLMFAPSGRTGTVMTSLGNSYTIAADGTVAVQPGEVVPLINAGFTLANRTSNSANGLAVQRLPLLGWKNVDGTTLSATASSGKFGLSETQGTAELLVGEAAQGNTKTDVAIYEWLVPSSYVAGQDVTLTVNAKLAGTGTAGTKTLAAAAYESTQAGAEGASYIATAAQNLPASSGDLAYTITGLNNLSPGDNIIIQLTTVVQETGGSATITANINSVRVG